MGGSKDRVASIRGSQPPSMGLSNSLTFAVLANRRLKNLIHLRFKESQPLKTPARSTTPLSRVQVRSSAWPVHGAIWSTCCHVFRCTLVETKIVIFRQVAAAAYICISHKCTHFDASWHYSGIEEREREREQLANQLRVSDRAGVPTSRFAISANSLARLLIFMPRGMPWSYQHFFQWSPLKDIFSSFSLPTHRIRKNTGRPSSHHKSVFRVLQISRKLILLARKKRIAVTIIEVK